MHQNPPDAPRDAGEEGVLRRVCECSTANTQDGNTGNTENTENTASRRVISSHPSKKKKQMGITPSLISLNEVQLSEVAAVL